MKRFGITALIAALCVVFSACGSGEQPVTTTAPEVVIQAAKDKNKVSVAREESFEYTDNNGNSYSASYRIPSINLDSEDAEEANEEITDKYTPDFEKAEQESAARIGLTCDSLDYEKFENEGVLSVVIRRVYYSHAVDYSVYNFNAKTGSSLGSDDVAKAAKFSAEEVQEALKRSSRRTTFRNTRTRSPKITRKISKKRSLRITSARR